MKRLASILAPVAACALPACDTDGGDAHVTVAGDAAQQIGTGSEFLGWDRVMDALGHGRAAPVTLTTKVDASELVAMRREFKSSRASRTETMASLPAEKPSAE